MSYHILVSQAGLAYYRYPSWKRARVYVSVRILYHYYYVRYAIKVSNRPSRTFYAGLPMCGSVEAPTEEI